jgi:hypothetical protein
VSGIWLLAFWIFSSPVAVLVLAIAIIGVVIFIVMKSSFKEQARQADVKRIKEDADARRLLITERYEPEIAQKILKNEIWQGMTIEQLQDSLGKADAIETVVTKRTRREIWRYDVFSTRVTLEDGVVVGWRQK